MQVTSQTTQIVTLNQREMEEILLAHVLRTLGLSADSNGQIEIRQTSSWDPTEIVSCKVTIGNNT